MKRATAAVVAQGVFAVCLMVSDAVALRTPAHVSASPAFQTVNCSLPATRSSPVCQPIRLAWGSSFSPKRPAMS